MKSLIIYESYFGNTEKIAEAIGPALASKGEAKVAKAVNSSLTDLDGVDLLVIGSPTREFSATKNINAFIKKLNGNTYANLQVAVFDTRSDIKEVDSKFLKFMEKRAGYADDSMVKPLQKQGMKVYEDAPGFFVNDSEGPLKDGEIERAIAWADTISA